MIINNEDVVVESEASQESDNRFMVANTQSIEFDHLRKKCTIPVFSKDNESTISHQEFIDIAGQAATMAFGREKILSPAIRVSHPIKGRIPSAVGKPAVDLQEHEKTIYYERMAFVYEIPSIEEIVNGNRLSLTVGGVRAYNMENLYGRKTDEKFKVFIGFKNWVCINLCISTDGFRDEIRVRTPGELFSYIYELFARFNYQRQLRILNDLGDMSLTETQFAQLIGRLRMFPFLKSRDRTGIPALELGEAQINSVIRDYYQDKSFCRRDDGTIDLWRFFNLLTGANKSSYIDTFLGRNVNALTFTQELSDCLSTGKPFWYLDGLQ